MRRTDICSSCISSQKEGSMNFNLRLKQLRQRHKLTQSELADILGVSVDSINRWENDTVEIEERNLELLYGFAYKKKFNINKIYEQIIIENQLKIVKNKAMLISWLLRPTLQSA